MRQSQQKTTTLKGKDFLLWSLVVAIFVAIVLGNLHFSSVNPSLKAAVILVLSLVSIGIITLTQQGKVIMGFVKEAHLELKKVVWPTRKETLQTSLLIFLIVLVVSLILWGVDSLFALLVSSILV